MFKIGEFSKISNTTVRALQHYQKLDLLHPAKVEVETNYRYYTADQLVRLNKIKALQQLGFPLKTIKDLLTTTDADQIKEYYQGQAEVLAAELADIRHKQNVLDSLQKQSEDLASIPNYHVVLKDIPQRPVVSLRRILPTFFEEGQLWQELYCGIQEFQVTLATPTFNMTIFHDQEYKEENVDIEVQCHIMGDYDVTDKLNFLTAPALQVASVTFNGDFEQMPQVTESLVSWLEANDYHIAGPMLNIPHVSPAQDDNPANWITEAAYVVQKNTTEVQPFLTLNNNNKRTIQS